MHILVLLQDFLSQWQLIRENRRRLSRIPKSRLKGINSLPVEIWGMILSDVVVDYLLTLPFPNFAVGEVLKLRRVCRVFDNEVVHSLQQYIRLPHLLSSPMLSGRRPGCKLDVESQLRNSVDLHVSLAAAALYNSTRESNSAAHYLHISRITDRIRNCLLIARYSRQQQWYDDDPDVLLLMLCAAASRSQCCQQYMHAPWLYYTKFKNFVQGDVYLEMALLVACGYEADMTKRVMVILGRRGLLKNEGSYSNDAQNVEAARRAVQYCDDVGRMMGADYGNECQIYRKLLDSWEELDRRAQQEIEREIEKHESATFDCIMYSMSYASGPEEREWRRDREREREREREILLA